MADDWKSSVEAALKNLADAIKDAAQLDVTTYAYDIDKSEGDAEKKVLVAQTEYKLDGDAVHYIPVQRVDGVLAVHQDLLAKHQESVDKAVAARLGVINSMKGMLTELKSLIE